jgi:hypothetical protein
MGQIWTGILKKLSLGFLALFLLGVAGHQHKALLAHPDSFSILREVPATEPPVAETIANLPQPRPTPEPDASLSQSPPLTPALPDRAEKKPARIVRSESYQRLEALIKKYAALHGVDEDLVWAVMRHESGFDPGAVSPKGAMGLMQLMPGTAALLGVRDPFNVEQNIQGGIRYLEMCLARFDQDVGLAVAAYNAGPENVARYQGCPPFPETQNYVAAVLQDYSGPPPRRGLRLRARGLVSPQEEVEPAAPSGLQWNLPAPVVNVAKPQLRLRPPRWHDFSLPWKLQAMAAKASGPPQRPGQPQ